MKIDRRSFTRAVSAATAAALMPRRALAQTATLKDPVPAGWLIGAAINQNQSDGRDTAAVDLVARQFNAITPENLLKFQSVQPQAGQFTFDAQDRDVAVGIDRKVLITEPDVNLLSPAGPPTPGQPPAPDANPYVNGLPDDVQQALARRDANAFRIFLTHRDDISRVTFWGMSDGDSWLNRGRVNHPLRSGIDSAGRAGV